jgi:hypothetical protein
MAVLVTHLALLPHREVTAALALVTALVQQVQAAAAVQAQSVLTEALELVVMAVLVLLQVIQDLQLLMQAEVQDKALQPEHPCTALQQAVAVAMLLVLLTQAAVLAADITQVQASQVDQEL